MHSKNAERINAEEIIGKIENLRINILETKKSKELFLGMGYGIKEDFLRFIPRSGGLRSKAIELIEQEIKRETVDSAEIPKTGQKVERVESKIEEGAETGEREQ